MKRRKFERWETHFKCDFMKISKQQRCIAKIIFLILICEIMLNAQNKIIQTIGICIVPIIVLNSVILLKNDQKRI